ncbi:MAG: hypothetical protein U0935_09880 [Pirellulales bacterium]
MSYRKYLRKSLLASMASAAWGAMVLMGLSPAMGADWGDLSGQFLLEGAAPKPARLNVNKDLECCGKYLDEIVDETITAGPNGGLANVFVYLRLPPGKKKIDVHPDLLKTASQPVVLDNIHCLFRPHALAVWSGRQTLLVTNSDPIGHAAKMDFLSNAPINVVLPAGGKIEQKLQNPESLPLPVSCGVHPWEIAYIKVHDSPYVTVSALDGKFVIPKLPTGEWEFQFWHESVGYLDARAGAKKGRIKLTIKPGANDLGTMKIPVASLKRK